MILTFDLGTTLAKATVWGPDGPVAEGRAELSTDHPQPGWDEQDPESWWRSALEAARRARAVDAGAWSAVEAIVFAAARETFALFDATGRALSPGIVWSDRRAPRLPHETGAASGRTLANLRWLATARPESFASARWALAPRDLVLWRLTGEVMTDATLAARTGCYRADGTPLDLAPAHLLAPVRPSTQVIGSLTSSSTEALDLPAGVTVVLGAGDRACEVLGTGAGPEEPMVSWGTTANVSLAVEALPARLDARIAVSPGALRGYLLECGLSAAGAALGWLGRITGRPATELYSAAASVPPGAGGVLATSWFNGARAPWWNVEATAAMTGLSHATGPDEMARAIIEGVAFDVARCAELVARRPVVAIQAAGGGAAGAPWPQILSAATGRPVRVRRPELAASAGALLIAAAALGRRVDLDDVNPVAATYEPEQPLVDDYRSLRAAHDRFVTLLLDTPE